LIAAEPVAAAVTPARIVAPMSETEKLINKQLLEKVAQAGLGQLTAGAVVRTKSAQQQAAKSGRV
jgi:hypothetical protein